MVRTSLTKLQRDHGRLETDHAEAQMELTIVRSLLNAQRRIHTELDQKYTTVQRNLDIEIGHNTALEWSAMQLRHRIAGQQDRIACLRRIVKSSQVNCHQPLSLVLHACVPCSAEIRMHDRR